MIRKHFDIQGDIDNLRSFTKLFEPMVWDYNEIVKINDNVWHQYSSLFDKIWLAGAFKGATFLSRVYLFRFIHYYSRDIIKMKPFSSPNT